MQLFYDVVYQQGKSPRKKSAPVMHCERFDERPQADDFIKQLPEKTFYVLRLVMCNDDFSDESTSILEERS